MLIVVVTSGQALPDDGVVYNIDDYVQHPQAAALWENWSDKGNSFWSEPPGDLVLTIDYRFRATCSSKTSYEIGTPEPPPVGYAPLSRLDFPINTCWSGFRFGLEKADSAAHFEWLAPMDRYINGKMEDFDWNINEPRDDPTRLDSLSRSSERWNDGQMLDLGYEFRLLERPLKLPIEVWPTIGFRWQRFNMTSYAGNQIIGNGEIVPLPGPFPYQGDSITFNQDYSMGYLGAQLRGKFDSWILPPIAVTLQGDWAYTAAYSVDHHLLRDGDMYGIQSTHGDCLHVALTAEAYYYRDRLVIGFQVDHLAIRTTGTTREINEPLGIDETWSNGVSASSDQTWLTAFIRTRF